MRKIVQKIRYAESLSDQGDYREYNQDAAFVYSAEDGAFGLALAADGVGAYAKSGLASSYTAECLESLVRENGAALAEEGFAAFREALCQTVQTIHDDLTETAAQMGLVWGTTLTLLAVYRGEFFCLQIGDSRLYLSENGKTGQITKDQTVAERKRLQGRTDITVKDENTLTQCIGIGEIAPDYYEGKFQGPAAFLVCSDGLCNTLSADEIEEVLGSAALSGSEKLQVLKELARSRGEKDNITGVLLELA